MTITAVKHTIILMISSAMIGSPSMKHAIKLIQKGLVCVMTITNEMGANGVAKFIRMK